MLRIPKIQLLKGFVVYCPSANCGIVDVKFTENAAQKAHERHLQAHVDRNRRWERVKKIIGGEVPSPTLIVNVKAQVQDQTANQEGEDDHAKTEHPVASA